MFSESDQSVNEEWIRRELAALRKRHLLRRPATFSRTGRTVTVGSRTLLNFSSNDYLGLARHPAVVASAERNLREYGCGATASRLVTGTLECHLHLEARLASLKGYPAALVFGSGYLTNAGAVSAVAGRGDHIFTDRLAHASIIDAVTLSRATLHRFRHNDAAHLDSLLGKHRGGGRRLVVTESVFSMDGDLAPLAEIARAAASHGAMLMVDEAHATGVFGPGGSGLVREAGLEDSVALSMGTLSKALGGYGGFVACSEAMRDLLVNRARAFIYTTGLPPAAVGAALGALDVLERNPGWGETLLKRAARFRRGLREAGLNTGGSGSQIVPVIVGSSEAALAFSERLRESGILAVAIRPPTVPEGTARIRFSVSLLHTDDDLERAREAIVSAANEH